MVTEFSKWFYTPKNIVEPDGVKFFFFPFAGVGPSSFFKIAKHFPAGLDIHVLSLPGRELRRKEDSIECIYTIAKNVADLLAPVVKEHKCVFWGHSMGSIIAFETLRLLSGSHLRTPLFVASGRNAPHIPAIKDHKDVVDMDRDEFNSLLRSYRGTPQVIFENKDLMDMLIPQLRADFIALDHYQYFSGNHLECDLLCINGGSDHIVDTKGVKEWARHSSGAFDSKTLSGDHFFIYDQGAEIWASISRAMEKFESKKECVS